MADKFQNKYRVPSARAQWWDYSANGLYFITICIKNRENILGNVNNGQVFLSDIGEIVNEEFEKSFKIRNELFCEIYVIMPNHIHTILRIENDETQRTVETHGRASLNGRASLRQYGVAYRVPKSISSFVAGFKSVATSRINQLRNSPGKTVWQPRFHDRIIRDHDAFLTIHKYILNNPSKWHEDTFFNPEQ